LEPSDLDIAALMNREGLVIQRDTREAATARRSSISGLRYEVDRDITGLIDVRLAGTEESHQLFTGSAGIR